MVILTLIKRAHSVIVHQIFTKRCDCTYHCYLLNHENVNLKTNGNLKTQQEVSEWLLFNTNSAIFQQYHGENIVILLVIHIVYIDDLKFFRTVKNR